MHNRLHIFFTPELKSGKKTAVFLVKKPDLEQSTAWLRTSDVPTTKMLINLNCLIW